MAKRIAQGHHRVSFGFLTEGLTGGRVFVLVQVALDMGRANDNSISALKFTLDRFAIGKDLPKVRRAIQHGFKPGKV